mgnify:CR=1 FL=1
MWLLLRHTWSITTVLHNSSKLFWFLLIWQNSYDSTVTSSTTGTQSVVNTNLDYTSGWYLKSFNQNALSLNLNSKDENIISNWNTNTFYTGTTTGLTIIHDGNRVNVYTQKEIEQLDKKNDYDNDVIMILTLSALLITIGLIIGLSI